MENAPYPAHYTTTANQMVKRRDGRNRLTWGALAVFCVLLYNGK